jgi:molecular chaperone DnaK
MRTTIDFGIDLGTSNSAIAVQVGAAPRLLPGPDGRELLPSAVRVRADGTVDVGSAAHAARLSDPANVAVEFKRQMGTGEQIRFPAPGRSYTPVELSAFVLRELAGRAERLENAPLRAAVITIPAMFQLAQCEATRQAASAAGIEHAPLLQEPIAAAMAHAGAGYAKEGYWLVYDLGGGTFDVSLVRSRAGRLQVIDHDGDNHLGGKDFNRVLARWAADRVRAAGHLGEFRRTDPALSGAFARLSAEAERVRIRLSELEQEQFHIPDLGHGPGGEPLGICAPVDRGLLEALIAPAIRRTTGLCQALLKRNRVTASELKGVVLVGGPTRTPCLTRILEEDLGLPARHSMDPTTIVAAGAALFAATQKLPPALRAGSGTTGASMELEYEAMTTNPRPLLVGRLKAPGGAAGLTVRVRRADNGYDSGPVRVGAEETFAVALALVRDALNVFGIAVERDGERVALGPGQFSILHGLSVAKPPLSQSVGVMLADNSVRWYLRKGVVLPAKTTVTHTITVPLARGGSGDAIKVPLVQGESERADRNKTIGVLCIHADGIARDIPAGAEVEVTLTIDEFSRTSARGYVPLLDQWFDQVVRFDADGKDAGAVTAGLTEQKERLRQLELQADRLAAEGGSDLDARIGEVEALIAEGDRDSVELADQMVRLMTRQIDKVEAGLRVEKLTGEFAMKLARGRQIITDAEPRRELEHLAVEFQAAIDRGDLPVAESKSEAAGDLVFRAEMTTIEFWRGFLGWLYQRFEALDMLGMAGNRFQLGVEAAQRDDIIGLRIVCVELYQLLPKAERAQFDGIVSHVM